MIKIDLSEKSHVLMNNGMFRIFDDACDITYNLQGVNHVLVGNTMTIFCDYVELQKIKSVTYKKCIICGEPFGNIPALASKGICSWRCWKDIYGEP